MGTHVVAATLCWPGPPALGKSSHCCSLGRFVAFYFFGNPPSTPRMGLGDDLVTIRVLSTHGDSFSGRYAQVNCAMGPSKTLKTTLPAPKDASGQQLAVSLGGALQKAPFMVYFVLYHLSGSTVQ